MMNHKSDIFILFDPIQPKTEIVPSKQVWCRIENAISLYVEDLLDG